MNAARELLDLVLRWIHVVAAIMWIGNSLLFNWLDRNLRPKRGRREGSRSEIWLLHSGGFYDVEKTLAPGTAMSRPPLRFKWQAYTTWLSGFSLLVVVYYLSGGALLIAPGSMLSPAAAAALGAGLLLGGWILYELLWSSPLARRPAFAATVSFALLLAAAYGLGHVFTGRATYLHVGALLGTLMAANVFLGIMPAQRALLAAVERGEPPDASISARARTRSLHNNYMTFPVIILMLSSHFSTFQGERGNWLVLGVLILVGAGARHMLNMRFSYRHWVPTLGATAAAGIAALYLLGARPAGRPPARHAAGTTDGVVPFETAERIIQKRCTVCHSAAPADRSFGIAPAGVALDTPDQIRAFADRIEARAVVSRTMPPGNKTWMGEEERELLARWLRQRRVAPDAQ